MPDNATVAAQLAAAMVATHAFPKNATLAEKAKEAVDLYDDLYKACLKELGSRAKFCFG